MARPRQGARLVRLPGKSNWYIKDGDIRRNSRGITLSTGTEDREDAKCVLASYLAKKAVPDQPTISQLLDMRLEDMRARQVRRVRDTNYMHATLKEHFGRLKPEQLSLPLISQFRQSYQDVPAMLREYLLELKTTLRMAKNHNIIQHVPPIIIPAKAPPRDVFLTHAEAEALWRAAHSAHLKLFIHLALVTGARKEAILQLTWDRVNLESRRIDFHDPDKAVTNKRRTLSPITAETAVILAEAQKFAETGNVIEFNGKPVKDIKKGFALAAKKAGLVNVTPHVLKHTAISWLAQAGCPIERIAALTSTNANTVRRIYQKFAPEHLQEEAEILGKAVSFATKVAKPVLSHQHSEATQ
jgi:integrase